jgi:hypothetical protein
MKKRKIKAVKRREIIRQQVAITINIIRPNRLVMMKINLPLVVETQEVIIKHMEYEE